MKLGKEDIQKIFLGCMLLIGIVYSYFDMLLGPLKRRHVRLRAEIAALEPQLAAARTQIRRTNSMEGDAPATLATVEQVRALIPESAPVAWYPTRVGETFKRQGVDKVATRPNGEITGGDALGGFRRMSWAVEAPKAEFLAFAQALAGFENGEPLSEIQGVKIGTDPNDPANQRIFLTVHNIVRQ